MLLYSCRGLSGLVEMLGGLGEVDGKESVWEEFYRKRGGSSFHTCVLCLYCTCVYIFSEVVLRRKMWLLSVFNNQCSRMAT